MKQLILIFGTIVAFSLLSCSKKKDSGSEPPTPVTADELSNYYFVFEEVKSGSGNKSFLTAFSFFKSDDGKLNANVYMYSDETGNSGPARSTLLENGVLSVNDGMNVFTRFTLTKAADGSINVVSAASDLSSSKIPYTEALRKKAGNLSYAGSFFQQTDNPNSYLSFSQQGKWGWNTSASVPENRVYTGIKESSVVGWTGTRHIGFMVPKWKNETGKLMIVQNWDAQQLTLFKEKAK